MGLQQISLTDYDTVVAVTERALNVALDGWLLEQETQVALYYTTDSDGNYVVATAETATIVFTGTLTPTLDPTTHQPVDLITLFTQAGPQTVQYNATFQNAVFSATEVGVHVVQGTTPWVVQFDVQLALQPTTIDALPANVQAQIQTQVENLGPDMFSIQQLWVDLNTAALASFQGIDGLSALGSAILEGVMKQYLLQQQAAAAMVFGYAAQFTGGTALAPTFMPTALDFCVTPYTPQTATSGPLDTLNYLVMVQGNPLPAYPPTSFGFNFVDDITVSGAIAIRHDFIIGQVVSELNGILQTISPVLQADAHADGDDGAIYVNPGQPATFTVLPSPSGSVVATYSYAPAAVSDEAGFFGGSTGVSAQYASTCQVQVGVNGTGAASPSTVLVSGTATFSGDIQSSTMGGGQDTTIPDTTYSWFAELLVQADLANNGQLDLVLGNTDFTSPPVVTGKPPDGWDRFLSGLAGQVQTYATGMTQLRAAVESQVVDNILGALQGSLAAANHFVFPGAQTFLFANPQFSPSDDLAADITYSD